MNRVVLLCATVLFLCIGEIYAFPPTEINANLNACPILDNEVTGMYYFTPRHNHFERFNPCKNSDFERNSSGLITYHPAPLHCISVTEFAVNKNDVHFNTNWRASNVLFPNMNLWTKNIAGFLNN